MEIGKKLKIEQTVTERESAASYGSGSLPVFATPAMIALMEKCSHRLAGLYLAQSMDTVGIEINVKHIRATPVGATVCAESEIISVNGKKIGFSVDAYDNKGIIGTGTHIRYIINPSEFIDNLS